MTMTRLLPLALLLCSCGMTPRTQADAGIVLGTTGVVVTTVAAVDEAATRLGDGAGWTVAVLAGVIAGLTAIGTYHGLKRLPRVGRKSGRWRFGTSRRSESGRRARLRCTISSCRADFAVHAGQVPGATAAARYAWVKANMLDAMIANYNAGGAGLVA